MSRLPKPDWTRPGETWRVEPETGWIRPRNVADYLCDGDKGRCVRPAAALRRTNRDDRPWCADHLRAGLMWIEDGRVVSWCLRP